MPADPKRNQPTTRSTAGTGYEGPVAPSFLDLTFPRLEALVRRRWGKGRFHAAAAYRRVFRDGRFDLSALPEFAACSAVAGALERELSPVLPRFMDRRSADGVTKFVLELADGERIETVAIPMANHTTLCVSSQVGCRMGCRFCETARLGLRRNLTAGEIVAQVFLVRFALGQPVRNVVFMGMGEPMDNLSAVERAVEVLADQRGLDIAPRHTTVSTVGRVDGIERLARGGAAGVQLAVSLNAVTDALRSELMPVNRRFPLGRLQSALAAYPLGPKRHILVSWALFRGVNDGPEHAAALARWLRPLKAKVNLIPGNPLSGDRLPVPSEAEILRFRDLLVAEGVFVRLRSPKGRELMAACGQLGSRRNEWGA